MPRAWFESRPTVGEGSSSRITTQPGSTATTPSPPHCTALWASWSSSWNVWGPRRCPAWPWWHGHRMLVDSEEDIHLHVWPQGSPEAVRHRLLHDWLRAHPDDRDLYASTKRRLAEDVPGVAVADERLVGDASPCERSSSPQHRPRLGGAGHLDRCPRSRHVTSRNRPGPHRARTLTPAADGPVELPRYATYVYTP